MLGMIEMGALRCFGLQENACGSKNDAIKMLAYIVETRYDVMSILEVG